MDFFSWRILKLVRAHSWPYARQLTCAIRAQTVQVDRPRNIPPTAFYFFAHDAKGRFERECFPVGPVGGERVVNIGNLKYPHGEWNLYRL